MTIPEVAPRQQVTTHIPELDGLRGIAALAVVIYHLFFWSMGLDNWSFFPRLVAAVTQFGWLGVDLFFVLSGFLITGVLLRGKGKPRSMRLFYLRRALRILPVYYGFLIILELMNPAQNTSFVLISLVYLSNAAPLFGIPMIYGPLWSLSVEEHFYLLWPWLVSAASLSAIAIASACLVVGEPLLRLWGFRAGADIYDLSWFRFDGLALGALGAVFVRSRYYSRARLTAIAGMAAVASFVLAGLGASHGILTRTRPLGAALQFTCSGVMFFGLVAAAVAWSGNWGTGWLRSRVLRFFGDISYCLYVVHLLVLFTWNDLVKRAPALSWPADRFGAVCWRAFCCIGISVATAALSRKYWEAPFLRLKERFE